MKKLLSIMGSSVLSLGVLFGFSGSASAAGYEDNYFTTNDGKWDGTFTVGTYGNMIYLNIERAWKNSSGSAIEVTDLKARLCNASTGNCTSYKTFYPGEPHIAEAYWQNLIPGTYRVDITEPYASTVSGYNSVYVNEDY
ncbi:hypothetical protein ABES33_28455 [Bacillus pseudomycoides]|uniref:hypothetical protein n=1 Tax=Bacillus pseudomycoides TaxID=64104 RepID=UPI003D243BAF